MDEPESINGDPYGSWLVKIKIGDPSELGQLMDASAYKHTVTNENNAGHRPRPQGETNMTISAYPHTNWQDMIEARSREPWQWRRFAQS